MMTPHEKNNLLSALKKAYEETEKAPTTTPCVDCGFWSQGACLKWKETIPLDMRATGCEEWVFNKFSPPF